MLMHDLAHSKPRIPHRRYVRFHAHQRPFDDAVIWLGAYGGTTWPAFSDVTGYLVQYDNGAVKERHVASLIALNVFIQSFLEPGASWQVGDSRSELWRIWPARSEPITFPIRGIAMNDDAILAITEQMRARMRDRFPQP
jgi:hypothetical protein